MADQRCERVHFPFTAKDPLWAARCLSVSCGQVVRVLRREPVPAQWCIAQSDNGMIGLLPTLILKKADPSGGSASVGSAAARRPRRHADPAAPLSVAEAEELSTLGSGGGSPTPENGNEEHQHKGAIGTVSSSSPSVSRCSSDGSSPHDESDAELFEEAVNRSRASRERLAGSGQNHRRGPGPGLADTATAGIPLWSYPAFCKGNREAQEVYRQLLHVRAETEQLARIKKKVDEDIVAATERAAEEAAALAKRNATAEADLSRVKQQVAELREACGVAKRLAAELAAPMSSECSGRQEARDSTLSEHDANVVLRPKADADTSADVFMNELVRCERETLASYLCQADRLVKRQEKLNSLLASLEEESRSLEKSERALVGLVGASPAGEEEWPRALDGLTDEENAALANYVRLYDKFIAKRNAAVAETPHDLAAAQKAKYLERIARGDAEAAKMTEELRELRDFVEKYGPRAAKLAEQIALGREIVAKKQAHLAPPEPAQQ